MSQNIAGEIPYLQRKEGCGLSSTEEETLRSISPLSSAGSLSAVDKNKYLQNPKKPLLFYVFMML